MKKTITLLAAFLLISGFIIAQTTQPIEIPSKGYRFQHRIKGPAYKKSRILELMVDEYGNYLVATYRGEKSSFVYLYIYNLYTWEEKYKIKLNDNRCELYNSSFNESGEFFYINYDVFRNKFREINVKTGEIREVDCSETPKGCRKLEQEIYKVDAYTIGDNYYLYRDPKFENYIKILVKKQMYIPKGEEGEVVGDFSPENGGVIQLTPAQIRELKTGVELIYMGIPIFFDANAIDANGNKIEFKQDEDNFKIRLTQLEISKLEKKISFMFEKFVVKLDLEALEQEQTQ